MERMKIKINFGITRIAVVRSIFLFSLATFVMVGINFIKTNGFHWWYLFSVPALVAYWYFDMRVIWQQEVDASYQYSNIFMELKAENAALKERLEFLIKFELKQRDITEVEAREFLINNR
jgi:hypothetical protein